MKATWLATEVEIMPQRGTKCSRKRHKSYRRQRPQWLFFPDFLLRLFVLFCGMVIMVSLRKYGGDRLRQEPERSSRCMPGYLMQLVKTRRGKQLPTMNWLSLPN